MRRRNRAGILIRVVPLHEEREPRVAQGELDAGRPPSEERAVGAQALTRLRRQPQARADTLDLRRANRPANEAIAVGGAVEQEPAVVAARCFVAIDRAEELEVGVAERDHAVRGAEAGMDASVDDVESERDEAIAG